MADSKKKKKTATVRTRVVEADTSASTPRKQKTSKKQAKKATPTTKAKKATKTQAKPKQVGYFKGAWIELKQVRWPNRKSTWSLTLAVITFTLFFTALVLLLDAGFKYLFDFIIK